MVGTDLSEQEIALVGLRHALQASCEESISQPTLHTTTMQTLSLC